MESSRSVMETSFEAAQRALTTTSTAQTRNSSSSNDMWINSFICWWWKPHRHSLFNSVVALENFKIFRFAFCRIFGAIRRSLQIVHNFSSMRTRKRAYSNRRNSTYSSCNRSRQHHDYRRREYLHFTRTDCLHLRKKVKISFSSPFIFTSAAFQKQKATIITHNA